MPVCLSMNAQRIFSKCGMSILQVFTRCVGHVCVVCKHITYYLQGGGTQFLPYGGGVCTHLCPRYGGGFRDGEGEGSVHSCNVLGVGVLRFSMSCGYILDSPYIGIYTDLRTPHVCSVSSKLNFTTGHI
jgi:hypothetical protein